MHEFGMELPLCAELLVTCEVVQKNEGLLRQQRYILHGRGRSMSSVLTQDDRGFPRRHFSIDTPPKLA
jgi:hypothetical protein